MILRRKITETVGWYGMCAILGAYALLSLKIISPGPLYQLLNLSGAIALIIDSWPDRNWQIIVLNSIWAAIGIYSVISPFF